MKKVKSPLIVAITAGLLAGTTIGVVAQEDASGGYSFKRLAQPTENAQTNFLGIAELPSGVLGVVGGSRPGGNGYEPLAWASRDGGETWTETPFDMPPGESGIGTIVTHGDAFVAVGGNGPFDATPTSRVFTSPDGVSWDAASTLDGAFITSLIATPDGLAMLGLEFREAEGFGSTLAGYPSLWLSTDATTWDVHEITTPLYGSDEEDPQSLSGLARSDDGDWLATGVVNDFSDEDGPPNKAFHVWHSPDGVEWTQGVAPVADTEGYFGTMTTPVWTPSGFLVNALTDSDDDPHGLFLTADGTSWEQVADIPGPDIPAMASDGSMTVGFRLPFTESDPPGLTDGAPVYVSPDGRSWEHPTPFSLEKGHVNAASFTPDGRLLMAGSDISGCREFFCVFNIDNGTVPAVWIGEPN